MGLFTHFPYTNFHDINLDWICGEVKKAVDLATKAGTIADGLEKFVKEYFDKLDISDEIRDALQVLYKNGILADIIDEYVSGMVSGMADLNAAVELLKARVDTLLKEGVADGELLDVRTGYNGTNYATAGEAVRGQISDVWSGLSNAGAHAANICNDPIRAEAFSRGHASRIFYDTNRDVEWLTLNGGAYEPYKTLKGSSFIKAPRKLCFEFENAASRIVINFYKLVGDIFVRITDVFEYISGTGRVNYVGRGDIPGGVIDVDADNVYFNIAVYAGGVSLYGWDGEIFGVPACGMVDFLKTDGTFSYFNSNGGNVFTVPGSATAVFVDGGAVRTIGKVANGEIVEFGGTTTRFAILDGNPDFYIVSYMPGYDFATGEYNKYTVCGEIPGVAILADVQTLEAAGRARKVVENARRLAAIEWTPATNVKGSGTERSFKAGVKYKGLPYASTWSRPGLVGWHISLQTFLSAVADPNSIFYTEKVNNDDLAPAYGINCTAFATLCDCWPRPQTNKGYTVDSKLHRYFTNNPVPGSIWTNGESHCLIPVRIDTLSDSQVVECVEAVTPILEETSRHSNIAEFEPLAYQHNRGSNYFDRYGWTVTHKDADPAANLESVGYLYKNWNNGKLTLGSARPYKGNYSVYTNYERQYISNGESIEQGDLCGVLVNIHRSDATQVYIYNSANVLVGAVDINGEQTVNIANHINIPGIYSVCTDVDDTREYFEYVKLEELLSEDNADNVDKNILYSVGSDGVLYDPYVARPDGVSDESICVKCSFGAITLFKDLF